MTETTDDFSAFVSRAWPGLVRTALLLTGDHAGAEDLAQSALVRTHRRWRSIRRQDRPEVYVRQVMLNLHRSWWRRTRGRERPVAQIPEAARLTPGAGTVPGAAGTDREAALDAALAELPPRMRATLVLRFYEDMSEHQVAAVLGCSVGTVKSQTSRGLARLRGALGNPEGSPPARQPQQLSTLRRA